jgi:glutamate-ammonia-ligase adenylyltransferase
MLFDLSERSASIPGWDKIERDIRTAVRNSLSGRTESATSTVIDRFAEALRDAGQGGADQLPIDIFTDVESSERYTLIRISSIDTPGFLFSFTNALASIHVNIARATIRTYDDVVQDTFWLTDSSGGKIEDEHRLNQLWVAAALIKQFTFYLPIAPDPAQALRQFNSLTSQLLTMRDWTSKLHDLDSPDVMETLARMMGTSRFLWEDFLRMQHENLFPVLLDSDSMEKSLSLRELEVLIDSDLEPCETHEERARVLNDFKDREMFRVDLRYITGRVDLGRFARELTDVADALIRKAFQISYRLASERHGIPHAVSGSVSGWSIFALGKFGGRDMGFGSDIELMFVYESEGMTDGDEPVPNSMFFEEVVREFLNVLETRQQGIFEIDMRLRPYGSKGPLASSLAAFRGYYSPEGDARQFERLAMVRMRPVLGDDGLVSGVMSVRDAFVYSPQPVDLDDILHMRRRQASELVKRGSLNAKLSQGGVVDIEYYVQAWQIAKGRADCELRLTNTLEAVEALRLKGHFNETLATSLSESYSMLRKLIDGLRIVRGNAKDLDIPARDSKEFQRLAHRMSEHGADHLSAHISDHMNFARRLWEEHPPPR